MKIVRKENGDVMVLEIKDVNQNYDHKILNKAIDDFLLSDKDGLEIDLSEFEVIDGLTVGVLIRAKSDLKYLKMYFKLINVTDRVKRFFQVMQLDAFFEDTGNIPFIIPWGTRTIGLN